MSSPIWLLTAALVFTPACAASPASLNPTPALGGTGELLRSEDSSQGTVSLWIAPMQVRSVHLAGAEASCVLQIGAVYSTGVGEPAGGHFVGLTLTFTYDAVRHEGPHGEPVPRVKLAESGPTLQVLLAYVGPQELLPVFESLRAEGLGQASRKEVLGLLLLREPGEELAAHLLDGDLRRLAEGSHAIQIDLCEPERPEDLRRSSALFCHNSPRTMIAGERLHYRRQTLESSTSSGSPEVLNTTTGMRLSSGSSRIACSASRPSILGMFRSSRIGCGAGTSVFIVGSTTESPCRRVLGRSATILSAEGPENDGSVTMTDGEKPWIEPVVLVGEVVRLDPLEREDVPKLWRVAQHESLWRWMPMTMVSLADMERAMEWVLSWPAAQTGQGFVTRLRESGEVVGLTTYLNANEHDRRVEIGFTWVTPAWQRTAVNTECKLLLLRHAFEVLGANRVEFKTDSQNGPSRAALARIGAQEEGTLRNHMLRPDGTMRHSVYFSVLPPEWPGVEDALTSRLALRTMGLR